MERTSSWPSTVLIWKRRYSLLRARPSSKTTMDATTSSPWKWEMSKHSMRSGAESSPSASAISSRARERVVRSEARLVLCRASACWALRRTVSIRARLSPRCGTRRLTALPRRSLSHCATGLRAPRPAWTRAGPVRGPPWARRRRAPRRRAAGGRARRAPAVPTSSTLSVTQPRWPRTRPPRTWKIWTAASSSSSARAIRSASVASVSTTAFFSMARLSASMSSRSRAAFSYSMSSAASFISRSRRRR